MGRKRVADMTAAELDRQRAQARARYQANAERMLAHNRAWAQKNRDRKRATNHAWQQKNRDRKRATNHAWQQKNRDRKRATNRAWQQKNQDRKRATDRACDHKRRASCKTSVAQAPTAVQLAAILRDPCLYCGDPAEHVDHFIPLARGGTHTLDNLVAACAACNLSKGAKLPDVEWTGRKRSG